MVRTVGFSVYVYEGISVLMPIMQASAVPEQFDKLLIYAVATLMFLYSSIGLISYLAYAGRMKQIATQLLPQDELLAQLLIIAYILVVVFGFPLSIYPVNQILESWTIDNWLKPTSSRNKCLITTLKNF